MVEEPLTMVEEPLTMVEEPRHGSMVGLKSVTPIYHSTGLTLLSCSRNT